MQMHWARDGPANDESTGGRAGMRHCLQAMFMGLVAILTVTMPSEAGSTIVTTTSFLFEPVSVRDLVVKYDLDGEGISSLKMIGAIPDDLKLSFNAISDIAVLHYDSPVDATFGTVQQFSFEVALPIGSASTNINILDVYYVESDHAPIAPTSDNLSFSSASVPEPGSMSLLSIGMTSFLAFRHWLKRRRLCV